MKEKSHVFTRNNIREESGQGMDMSLSMSLNSQNNYEIRVYGQPDEALSGWFGEAKASTETLAGDRQVTTFADVVMDQAGLVGLIRRLHGHGIVLISVRQIEPEPHSGGDSTRSESNAVSVNEHK